nr:hypothetical protein [Tanacetum cinerariifolium]
MKTSKDEEDLKGMMQLVPVEEVYVEALQVKHPIIDWEIHSEEFALLVKIRINLGQRHINLSQRRMLVIHGMYPMIDPMI